MALPLASEIAQAAVSCLLFQMKSLMLCVFLIKICDLFFKKAEPVPSTQALVPVATPAPPNKCTSSKIPVDDLICPITRQLLWDPVTAEDGR